LKWTGYEGTHLEPPLDDSQRHLRSACGIGAPDVRLLAAEVQKRKIAPVIGREPFESVSERTP
jgi:hypothetical protein